MQQWGPRSTPQNSCKKSGEARACNLKSREVERDSAPGTPWPVTLARQPAPRQGELTSVNKVDST